MLNYIIWWKTLEQAQQDASDCQSPLMQMFWGRIPPKSWFPVVFSCCASRHFVPSLKHVHHWLQFHRLAAFPLNIAFILLHKVYVAFNSTITLAEAMGPREFSIVLPTVLWGIICSAVSTFKVQCSYLQDEATPVYFHWCFRACWGQAMKAEPQVYLCWLASVLFLVLS